MSSLRKVLLAMLLVSLTGSAFGAGTFASFTATTTNAGSAFATGSLVLSNDVAGSTCYSNTESADHDSAALAGAAGDTDDNSNDSCSATFTAGIAKPGDTSTSTVILTNAGSLAAANGVGFYGTAACTNGQRVGETFFGTGNMCEQLQIFVQDDAGGAGACKYGSGAGATWKGAVNATLTNMVSSANTPIVINTSNDQFTITVTGGTNAGAYNLTIPTGSYSMSTGGVNGTNVTLQGALQTAANNASAPLLFGVGADGIVYVATTAVSAVTTIAASGGEGIHTTLGLGSMTQHAAAAAATCGWDPAHSVAGLAKFTSTATLPVIAGSWAAAGSKTFSVDIKLDTAATNVIQGKSATWSMSWISS